MLTTILFTRFVCTAKITQWQIELCHWAKFICAHLFMHIIFTDTRAQTYFYVNKRILLFLMKWLFSFLFQTAVYHYISKKKSWAHRCLRQFSCIHPNWKNPYENNKININWCYRLSWFVCKCEHESCIHLDIYLRISIHVGRRLYITMV